jgi:hypothetical protein
VGRSTLQFIASAGGFFPSRAAAQCTVVEVADLEIRLPDKIRSCSRTCQGKKCHATRRHGGAQVHQLAVSIDRNSGQGKAGKPQLKRGERRSETVMMIDN